MPRELVDDIALVGSPERIRERLALWEQTAVTTVVVQGDAAALRAVMAAA